MQQTPPKTKGSHRSHQHLLKARHFFGSVFPKQCGTQHWTQHISPLGGVRVSTPYGKHYLQHFNAQPDRVQRLL